MLSLYCNINLKLIIEIGEPTEYTSKYKLNRGLLTGILAQSGVVFLVFAILLVLAGGFIYYCSKRKRHLSLPQVIQTADSLEMNAQE